MRTVTVDPSHGGMRIVRIATGWRSGSNSSRNLYGFNSYGFPIDAKQIPGFSALNERRAAGRLDIGSDLGSAASAMTNASY